MAHRALTLTDFAIDSHLQPQTPVFLAVGGSGCKIKPCRALGRNVCWERKYKCKPLWLSFLRPLPTHLVLSPSLFARFALMLNLPFFAITLGFGGGATKPTDPVLLPQSTLHSSSLNLLRLSHCASPT